MAEYDSSKASKIKRNKVFLSVIGSKGYALYVR